MSIEKIILNLFNGVSFGMLLFLLSSGLSLIMGLMAITNLSHGALYMIGTYVGYTIAVKYGLNFGLGIFLGGLSSGLVGLFIERLFLRRLYKQPDNQVLVTYGFVYIITNLIMLIWGSSPHMAFTAPIFEGAISLGAHILPIRRIIIIFAGIFVAIFLWWFQGKTRFGAVVRAVMDNKEAAAGFGINVERVSMLIFLLSAFIAGIAGVLGAQILGVYSELGIDVLLFALIVVIVGGIGSVEGCIIGSLLIGIIDSFGRALLPGFASYTMYIVMIVILLVRPEGIIKRRA